MYSEKTIPGFRLARRAAALMAFATIVSPVSAHEGDHGPAPRPGRSSTAKPAQAGAAPVDGLGLRMRLVAPTAGGVWGLRIDNTSSHPVRLAADVRLLRLTITPPASEKSGRRKPRVTVCDGPTDFGLRHQYPAGRALILAPGFSYAERFDPRLICFGAKAKHLVSGATVSATYGFRPKAKWQRGAARPPFVVEFHSTGDERVSRRWLVAPWLTLPGGMSREANAAALQGFPAPHPGLLPPALVIPKETTTATAPATASKTKASTETRLTLTTSRHADAAKKRDLRLSVQAHNAGPRPLLVALRARQLSFLVAGPDGTKDCRKPGRHHVPRDLLRRLKEGKHIHIDVLLGESCPNVKFVRPGLYRARPIMYAIEADDDSAPRQVRQRVTVEAPGAVGGTHHKDDDASLIRIRLGQASLYAKPPRSVATAALND